MMIRQFSRSYASTSASAPIKAGLILSRTPIVTPDIPEFEKLFYNYQEELERRLMWTFPKWYYFKKGTVAEREFTEAQKYPVPAARGVWFPHGVPDIKHGRDRRFKQDVILPKKHTEESTDAVSGEGEGGEESTEAALAALDDIGRPIKPNSRITESDKTNDQTSLERKLPRTLYLLIKDSSSKAWKFPSFDVSPENTDKGLHQIAEDGLRTLGGDKINTWCVSNSPAAVLKDNETREFLIKSHIVAGKFDLQKSAAKSATEYKWLVKEEIKDLVDASYYNKIEHLLSEQ